MSNFFRWLWTGFGTRQSALQALGITIFILLIGVWAVWWVIKFFIWLVTTISNAASKNKTNGGSTASA